MAIGDISGRDQRPRPSMTQRAGRVTPAHRVEAPGNDRHPANASDGSAATGRALVPLAKADDHEHTAGRMARPVNAAAFIAHLVATAVGAEQTRVRRRASAADGNAAYRATDAALRAAPSLGRNLRLSA